MNLPQSTLTKNQKRTVTGRLTVYLRYDDECNNGHNTFSIITRNGCDHARIVTRMPHLAKYIKWHLMSSEGPIHYIANSLYWAKQGDLEAFRVSAC